MALQKWLEQLRKWVDEEDESVEEQPARPRSKWEDFLVSLAREVEKTMLAEMFTPPGGPTYIPREYIVFLSPQDDSEWQGEKREGLERGLRHVLTERAKELVGEKEFQTRSIALEVRVDGTLEAGRFRVQHIWDADAQKTMVKPRTRPRPAEEKNETDEEATIVRPRKPAQPSFTISIRRLGPDGSGAPAQPREFFKNEITIGRGSKNVDVDLQLKDDLEVSRKHATLAKEADGRFRLTCHGANPILLGADRELPAGESAELGNGEKVTLSSYELVVN
jgi:hypothetical protein